MISITQTDSLEAQNVQAIYELKIVAACGGRTHVDGGMGPLGCRGSGV